MLSYHETLPWSHQYLHGLRKFREHYSGDIEYFIEEIDAFRLQGGASDEVWINYLKDKYHAVSFDGILVESDAATQLFTRIRGKLFPDIPAVTLSFLYEKADTDIFFGVNLNDMTERTLELVRRHNHYFSTAYIIHADDTEGLNIEMGTDGLAI